MNATQFLLAVAVVSTTSSGFAQSYNQEGQPRLSASEPKKIVFYGTLVFDPPTPSNSSCWGPGASFAATFYPKNVTGSGNANWNYSALNIFGAALGNGLNGIGGFSYVINGGSFTSNFQSVTGQGISVFNAYTPGKPSFIKVTSQTPSTLTNTTKAVTLAGQMKNPIGLFGQENCIASFVMSGVNVAVP
jgi:hypothetical protein